VFDVLHLEGLSTRGLPYRERRAQLDELALNEPSWRTPASLVVGPSDEFVARVAGLGLEGVVAKRLDSALPSGATHRLVGEAQAAPGGAARLHRDPPLP
jgi:ATP-dependent DNA ligase